MKRRLFKTFVALLAIAAAATGPAWAQNSSPDVTLDFTTNDWGLPTSNTMTTESYTDGTYSITLSATYAYKFTSGYLLLGKSGSYLELPEFSSPVEKIEVVGNSAASGSVNQNIYVGGTAVSTQTTGAKGTNTYVINENYRAAGNIYTLKVENAYNTQITYIKVYYVSSGGGSTPEPEPAPPTPHTVRMAAGTEDAANWTLASGNASVPGTQVLENVMSGSPLTATYNGTTKKVKSVKAVKYVPPVLVQSIVLNKQTASLAKDSTMTLSVASVLPENAADKSYSWSSDNTSVAIVNATTGVVTGMAAGTANIIATANDGSGAADTCVVTVLRTAILDGVTVLYASDNDTWSTIIGYNPGVLYQDGNKVRLTSNGAFLFFDGILMYVNEHINPLSDNYYQWLRKAEISGSELYYRQGETWQQAIDANRLYNNQWSINDGKVIFNGDFMLVDDNREPVDPTATIGPSTVDYHFEFMEN